MSVLIKDMGMPESCDNCELCTCYVREDGTEENYRCVITFYPIHKFDERHEYCPLVEIPPHGRLIDADVLIDAIIAKYIRHERNRELVFAAAEIKQDLADIINELPTIIEAEEGE